MRRCTGNSLRYLMIACCAIAVTGCASQTPSLSSTLGTVEPKLPKPPDSRSSFKTGDEPASGATASSSSSAVSTLALLGKPAVAPNSGFESATTPRGAVQLVAAQEPLPPPSRVAAPQPSVQPVPVAPELVGSGDLAPGVEACDVTMVNVLATVAGRNPEVGFANQRYAEAYARLLAAQVLWLPQINAGIGWNNHAGPLQDTLGIVRNINRSSLTAGLGVQTIGAGSPVVPGLFANFHAANAIFQPLIANRAAAARDAAVRQTINDLLLDTSLAYLELLRAYQFRAIAIDIRGHAEQLARSTADFARTGEGTAADADRAATELAIRQNEVVRAEEDIQVTSARVVELLNGDPRYVLRPLEPAIAPVELVPIDVPLVAILPTGLQRRPELSAAQHLVGEAIHRLRMEKASPWLPNVLMGSSYAAFGGGTGSQINNTAGRFDLDAIAYWQVRSLGVGEVAARREAQARLEQTRFEQTRRINEVSREIVQAHAQIQARHRQIAIAQQAVARAIGSFERNWMRVRDLQGLPIETLQSIQALDQARREYLRVLVDYNAAQFRLQRALGWPISL
ncbi:MAG: TolC family protein [Pirellulales bacterium]|nr:TolC family protein [Pirellulales bacterium]